MRLSIFFFVSSQAIKKSLEIYLLTKDNVINKTVLLNTHARACTSLQFHAMLMTVNTSTETMIDDDIVT